MKCATCEKESEQKWENLGMYFCSKKCMDIYFEQ